MMRRDKEGQIDQENDTVPISIRFTREQLKVMDDAVEKGAYFSRSEAVRDAVRTLFKMPGQKQVESA